MPTLYIAEFTNPPIEDGEMVQVAKAPTIAEDTVTIAGTSAASAAFNAKTEMVRLHTDTACHIQFGTSPTATTSLMKMAADTTEYFSVPKGASYKVAVIEA